MPDNFLRKIMEFSDEDKILIKNLHDSKGYRGYGSKKLIISFLKKLEQKGTVMQRRVYVQRQIHMVWMNWNDSSSMSGYVLNSQFLTRLLASGEKDFERASAL